MSFFNDGQVQNLLAGETHHDLDVFFQLLINIKNCSYMVNIDLNKSCFSLLGLFDKICWTVLFYKLVLYLSAHNIGPCFGDGLPSHIGSHCFKK